MLRFTTVALAKTTARRRAVGTAAAAAATAASSPATTTTAARAPAPPRPTMPASAAAAAAATTTATVPKSAVTPPAAPPAKKKVIKKVVRKKVVKSAAPLAAVADEAGAVSTGEELRRELRGLGSAVTAAPTHAEDGLEPSAEDGTSAGQKTAMVKGYKIEEVVSLCTPSDAIFARRLPAGGCQFFAWPGTSLEVASAAIVSMPDTIRTVHAVFGRRNTPIDLVMDVDCPVPREEWTMAKIRPFQQKVLDDVLTVVTAELAKIGETIETQVVLQSPNLKKASFHIHTRLKDAAFADYESVHGFLASFHGQIPTVDLQIYRTNGMLRMYSCMKENRTSAMTVMENTKWNIGFPNGNVPPEAAALHSVCVRDADSFSRVLTYRAPWTSYGSSGSGGARAARPGAAADGDDESAGTGARSTAPTTVLIPRNAAEAVENASAWLRHATEAEVGEWRTWIGLGLCAFRLGHHFRDASGLPRPAMELMLKAWEEASRNCPQKYRNGECAERWATFDPTKLSQSSEAGWWGAYKRLGRLEWASQESRKVEEASKARRK